MDSYTVIQADRDAAASGYYAWISSNRVIASRMTSGVIDDHSMVQAFARHRAQSIAPYVDALREARDCIEGLHSQFDFAGCTCTFPSDDCCSYAATETRLARIDSLLSQGVDR